MPPRPPTLRAGDVPTRDLRTPSTAPPRVPTAEARTRSYSRDPVGDDHDPRVLVGLLEQADIVRRGYDAGRADAGRASLRSRAERGRCSISAAALGARCSRRVDRIVSFAESDRCRHLQVAEHFDEHLRRRGARATSAPPRGSVAAPTLARAPRRSCRAIVDAVPASTGCSLAEPRSVFAAQSPATVGPPRVAFGSLAAASGLEGAPLGPRARGAGAPSNRARRLRVLQARPEVALPARRTHHPRRRIGPLVEELRAWRSRRAREDKPVLGLGRPARWSSKSWRRRPQLDSTSSGAAVKGFGPAKLDRYGELLAVLADA